MNKKVVIVRFEMDGDRLCYAIRGLMHHVIKRHEKFLHPDVRVLETAV